MVTVHDKEIKTEEEKLTETKPEEAEAATPVENTEVLKEETVVPDIADESADIPSEDPLTSFKQRNEEELSYPNDAPKKNYMWPILFIFIIAIALLGGIFAYKQGLFKEVKVSVVTPSPTPTVTPEPTKVIDLTKYEIEIQNGSGIDGEASRQKLSLTAAGFTVSSVGNADNSDYTDTILKAKANVDKDFLAKLKTTLEASFTVKEEVLPDTALTPVIIILGTKI